jgi:methionine synthase I (cobalamin-dependent)
MVRTQVQLTKEQADSLKQLAAKRKVSIAHLIRQGVDQVLRETFSPSRAELRERALKAAGRFRSGGLNLSENHDEYFVEAIERGHKK